MKARCIAKLPMPAQKMARMAISIGLQMGPYVWKCQPLCGYGRDEGKAKPFIPIEIQPSFLPEKDPFDETIRAPCGRHSPDCLGRLARVRPDVGSDGVAAADPGCHAGAGFRNPAQAARSEGRRVGKECYSKCRSQWSP